MPSESHIHPTFLFFRNKKLSDSQQITNDDLEVNPRITDDLMKSIDEKLSLLQRKFAFDIEKSRLLGNKVKEYFLKPLENYPIKVQGILSNLEVETFKIPKLSDDFYSLRSDVEERIRIDAERRRYLLLIISWTFFYLKKKSSLTLSM